MSTCSVCSSRSLSLLLMHFFLKQNALRARHQAVDLACTSACTDTKPHVRAHTAFQGVPWEAAEPTQGQKRARSALAQCRRKLWRVRTARPIRLSRARPHSAKLQDCSFALRIIPDRSPPCVTLVAEGKRVRRERWETAVGTATGTP